MINIHDYSFCGFIMSACTPTFVKHACKTFLQTCIFKCESLQHFTFASSYASSKRTVRRYEKFTHPLSLQLRLDCHSLSSPLSSPRRFCSPIPSAGVPECVLSYLETLSDKTREARRRKISLCEQFVAAAPGEKTNIPVTKNQRESIQLPLTALRRYWS